MERDCTGACLSRVSCSTELYTSTSSFGSFEKPCESGDKGKFSKSNLKAVMSISRSLRTMKCDFVAFGLENAERKI